MFLHIYLQGKSGERASYMDFHYLTADLFIEFNHEKENCYDIQWDQMEDCEGTCDEVQELRLQSVLRRWLDMEHDHSDHAQVLKMGKVKVSLSHGGII